LPGVVDVRWLADENLNNDIIRGLIRRHSGFDIVRVQDVGLGGCADQLVLEWAAVERRLLLTHDVTTITEHAYRRVLRGETMPGVFAVKQGMPIGMIVEDISLVEQCSAEEDWEGRIVYLPFPRAA
jgi:hypothetical protein